MNKPKFSLNQGVIIGITATDRITGIIMSRNTKCIVKGITSNLVDLGIGKVIHDYNLVVCETKRKLLHIAENKMEHCQEDGF